MKIELDKGGYEIHNRCCVNSNHVARFLAGDSEDWCQCGFGECKVRVAISYNGHSPYTYILTEKEIANLPTLSTPKE